MPTEQKSSSANSVHLNSNLPTLFVDGVVVTPRKDGVFLINFLTGLPDGSHEQVRILTNTNDIQRIIGALCNASNFFPKKPAKKTTKSETRHT